LNFPVALEGALKLKEISYTTPRISGGGDEARSYRAHNDQNAGRVRRAKDDIFPKVRPICGR